jgi:molecular chaperone GrpE
MSKHQRHHSEGETSPEVAEMKTDVAEEALEDAVEIEESRPEDNIKDLEAQVADLKDQLLRKAADFDNFRKRMNRDKQDAIDFANQKVFEDLIPIIDDLERAIKSAETTSDKALYEGISMIEKQLVSMLENKWGLKRFEAKGLPFDPTCHEALMMDKSSDVEEATVAEDLIKGYMLKDRVIRPAKVKVLMPE